jgi:hypothetical protein
MAEVREERLEWWVILGVECLFIILPFYYCTLVGLLGERTTRWLAVTDG